MQKYLTATSTAVIIIAVISCGYFIRMIPAINYPTTVQLRGDMALNYRMTQEVVKHGSVPLVDHLTLYPIGRKTHDTLPILFYYIVGAFHYIVTFLFGPTSLLTSILKFSSLCGAAMAIPVYIATFAITKKRFIAIVSAIISVTFPLGIVRNFCTYFRFELLGVLFIMMAFAYVLKAVSDENLKSVLQNAAVASIFMMLSTAVWRVGLLFYTILAISFLLIFIFYKDIRNAYVSFIVIYIGYLAVCFLVPYIRASNYIFSLQTFLMTIIVIIPKVMQFVSRWIKKILTVKQKVSLAIILLLSIILASMMFRQDVHTKNAISMMKLAVVHKTGMVKTLGYDALLFQNISELAPLKIKRLPQGSIFSVSILLILCYIYVVINDFRTLMARKENLILFVAWSIFAVLTVLVVVRMGALWAPLSAIAMGAGVGRLYDKQGLDGSAPDICAKRHLVYSLLALTIVITSTGSFHIMLSLKRDMTYEKEFNAVLTGLRRLTPPDSVVWTNWVYNYPIQTYSNRATVTDALFEDEEVRKRILEESRVLSGDSEEALMNFIDKYNIYYIVVSTAYFPYSFQYAGLDIKDYVLNKKLTAKGMRTITSRLLFSPNSFKELKLLYKAGIFSVYSVPKRVLKKQRNIRNPDTLHNPS